MRDDQGLNKAVVVRKEQKDGLMSYLRGSMNKTSLIRPKAELKRRGRERWCLVSGLGLLIGWWYCESYITDLITQA